MRGVPFWPPGTPSRCICPSICRRPRTRFISSHCSFGKLPHLEPTNPWPTVCVDTLCDRRSLLNEISSRERPRNPQADRVLFQQFRRAKVQRCDSNTKKNSLNLSTSRWILLVRFALVSMISLFCFGQVATKSPLWVYHWVCRRGINPLSTGGPTFASLCGWTLKCTNRDDRFSPTEPLPFAVWIGYSLENIEAVQCVQKRAASKAFADDTRVSTTSMVSASNRLSPIKAGGGGFTLKSANQIH